MAGEKVINIISIEAIVCVTELAVHVDAALFVEDAVALVLADGFQRGQGAFVGTAAAEGNRIRLEQAHRFLVEQPVQQGFARDFRPARSSNQDDKRRCRRA